MKEQVVGANIKQCDDELEELEADIEKLKNIIREAQIKMKPLQ